MIASKCALIKAHIPLRFLNLKIGRAEYRFIDIQKHVIKCFVQGAAATFRSESSNF